jgi:vacuolar-type H+-ATPase subunit F/Vma7
MIYFGDRLTSVGFRLSGLKKAFKSSGESLKSDIMRFGEREEIILVSNRLLNEAGRDLEDLRRTGRIIIPIPDETGGGEDYINDLIRKAIGFEFKRK